MITTVREANTISVICTELGDISEGLDEKKPDSRRKEMTMAIISDNDLEIILKGSQEDVIRKMLDNRLFCLIRLPAGKPKNMISVCSSSVFVGSMNSGMNRSFAIRNTGSKTIYGDCEYYLSIYYQRGTDDESKGYFEHILERRKEYFISITYPSLDELLAFLNGKELVLITNWMNYGNMEAYKVEDFLNRLLFIRKECGSKYIRKDEFCDIRVYLTRVEDDESYPDYGLYCEDVRNFDIRKRIVDQFYKKSKEYFGDVNYYSAEFETQTKDVQAAYFLTRFHSNTCWEADPVNIVNARISAFVLPGMISPRKAKKLPFKKKTRNEVSGTEYMIESIHCNSDIFPDFDEFKEYIATYLVYFAYD